MFSLKNIFQTNPNNVTKLFLNFFSFSITIYKCFLLSRYFFLYFMRSCSRCRAIVVVTSTVSFWQWQQIANGNYWKHVQRHQRATRPKRWHEFCTDTAGHVVAQPFRPKSFQRSKSHRCVLKFEKLKMRRSGTRMEHCSYRHSDFY